MNKISKIYFINLDRRPDRYEHFLKQCNEKLIDFSKIIRFKAIDGNLYKFTDIELSMFNNVDYKGKNYERNIIGNQLSHLNILKDMVRNEYEYIIIFQDDVILRKNFIKEINKIMTNIPKDTEIINIGYHKFASYNTFIPYDLNNNEESELSKKNINENICILNDTINPCSLGYIVSLKGAINLIEFFNRNGFLRATDWNYNDYLKMKNIYYGSRLVLATGNPNFQSDVFI
jgi:GR25 family glycosyltransferase involved in LPS biosynthesis